MKKNHDDNITFEDDELCTNVENNETNTTFQDDEYCAKVMDKFENNEINDIMFEDDELCTNVENNETNTTFQDDEYCAKVMDKFENNEINDIMFEDDEYCTKVLDNFEKSKHKNMIEVAPDIFVENIPAGPSNQNIVSLNTLLEEGLQNMIENIKKITNFTDGDIVNMHANNPKFFTPISTGNMTCNVSGEKILNKISDILTSDQSVNINDTVFGFQVIIMPKGGKPKPTWEYLDLFSKNKRCIAQIKNQDELCCPRAIIVGLSYKTSVILGHKLNNYQIKNLRLGKYDIQTRLTKELCQQLEINDSRPFTYRDISKVEKLLKIQVKVVNADNCCEIDYTGTENRYKVYLLKKNDHFHCIFSMSAFRERVYYCELCDTGYNNKKKHACKNGPGQKCRLCNEKYHIQNFTCKKIFCHECNRYCVNNECLRKHKNVCDKEYKCNGCNFVVQRNDRTHTSVCGYGQCHNCKQENIRISDHKCYMQRRTGKGGYCVESCICNEKSTEKQKNCTFSTNYVFFDYEAQQNTGTHIPNMVIAHDFEGRKYVFSTDDAGSANDKFCKWALSKVMKGTTYIAHNSKAYDTYFIIQYILKNMPTVKYEVIRNGTKIMMLEIKYGGLNIKFIDSHNFIQSKLSEFPKTFGLKEAKKGYFPHFFNTPENQRYVGPLPDKTHYGYNSMTTKHRAAFINWHDELINKNYVFDFQLELEEYCNSDVDILRRGCLELRKQFLDVCNIDPFKYITIASVCMAIYRQSDLSGGTIAVVQNVKKDNFSDDSIKWLKSKILNENKNIKHALNGGEVTICGARVDGYDETEKKVYQYHGCFWHGCPECFNPNDINPVNNNTMTDLYNDTIRRTINLKQKGYQVEEMWSCKWKKHKNYKQMLQYQNDVIEPLNPRDAFFGGRTNATNLYPTVMYYDNYPVGHPKQFFNPSIKKYSESNWYGFIKCKILPPTDLYHPVLPVKTNKLIFTLCKQCQLDKIRQCTHNDEQKALIGTWTTDEVQKALEKGYKIMKIYEVQHFEKKSNTLFKEYIKRFLKIKLETSSWKNDYRTVNDYISAVKNAVGIDMDIENIKENPGLRALAKICLNSFWGKFGQRPNQTKTEIISKPDRWYQVLLDSKLETENIVFLTDDLVEVSYKKINEYVGHEYNTSIYVAAFTTSNARLRLYTMLDNLGEKVVYYDTDSVFYIYDDVEVKTGCMLGEWTDELGPGIHITDWYEKNNER
ncbi:uncharacterized protein LOC132943701 [Metopolophium dirhodum]|uniref:uncharacterized protein LOC132943701 n=1 Tax=Metopolophium dirhodum TaxID=44670 RepID=UPI00298F8E65|nr:uncharacterized protein LOC132943701 [Metopolophium dirhodum]